MKTAYGKLAVLAAFVLASVTILVPAAPATPAAPAEPRPDANIDERNTPQSIYSGTAIGAVLEANNNEVPKSGEQMMKTLAKLGQFAQLPVTFSAVDLHSGLSNPRVVITQRPSQNTTPGAIRPGPKGIKGDDIPVELGGFGPPPTQAALHNGKLTRPNLEGRLFLAANMEKKGGELKVKTFEFISWNSRKQKFDFGFIECDEVEPQIRIVDGVRCFSCHKNKGPILGLGPWSNTPHNDVVRAAVASRHTVNLQALCLPNTIGQPSRLDTGFDSRIVRQQRSIVDGMSLLVPQGPAVDAAVRMGAELVRDREVYRAMSRSADGRKGIVVLFSAIAAPGSLEQNNQNAKVTLDQTFATNYPTFAEKWLAIHKNSSSTLVDFNPAGSIGTLQSISSGSAGGWGSGSTLQSELRIVWGGDPKQITDYDAKRAEGEHGLPSARQPSNPKAFVRPVVALPGKPSAAVNATGLARLIGLTEGDRAFLADQLAVGSRQVDKSKETLAKDVFSGPQFADLLAAGDIPDREDFKDRFVKGLNDVLKAHKGPGISLVRSDYASGPKLAPQSKDADEVPVVATTACLRCHDVRGVGKPTFSPIPLLAFDPFDKASREAWTKATPDAKKRAAILARMMKRVSDDRDMPPEDSAEYDTFRMKKSADFEAVRDWLDVELKRAKGG